MIIIINVIAAKFGNRRGIQSIWGNDAIRIEVQFLEIQENTVRTSEQ